MKRLKSAFRMLALMLLVIMASFGIGITGALFAGNKERYQNNEVKTEQLYKKDEEDTESKGDRH